MGIKQDIIAACGEFIGTAMFLFLGLGGIKTAQNSETVSQQQTAGTIALSNQTILFISTSMGLSLLVTAWIFYRITGGLFNPAITLALWLIGAVPSLRAALLVVAQLGGGIAGAALVAALTPYGGVENTITKLSFGVNIGQGLFMEAFLTAILVFSVLMLAAEKHKATYIAPIGIGLVLFVCQLLGTNWTGCGMNPARSFGPSVVSASFPGYHWIYWVGPLIGALISVTLYTILKVFDYGSVVLGQDSDQDNGADSVATRIHGWSARHGFTRAQREALAASGMKTKDIDKAEKGMIHSAAVAEGVVPPTEEDIANGSANGIANGGLANGGLNGTPNGGLNGSANGSALDGSTKPAPAIKVVGNGHDRPEMTTSPSHVRQTLPNGQVAYVRQNSIARPGGGGRLNSARPSNSTRSSNYGNQNFGSMATGPDASLTDSHVQDHGAIAGTNENKSPLGLHKLHGLLGK